MRYEERELGVTKSSGVVSPPSVLPSPKLGWAAPPLSARADGDGRRPPPPPRAQTTAGTISLEGGARRLLAGAARGGRESLPSMSTTAFAALTLNDEDGQGGPKAMTTSAAASGGGGGSSGNGKSSSGGSSVGPNSADREQEVKSLSGPWVYARRDPRDHNFHPWRRYVFVFCFLGFGSTRGDLTTVLSALARRVSRAPRRHNTPLAIDQIALW